MFNAMTLFSSPYALIARWVVLAIACAALWGHGWFKGNNHGTDKLTDYIGEQAVASAKVTAKQVEVTEKIRIKYVEHTKTIKEKGDEITMLVPVYITSKDDAACVINRGAQRLHDSAANTVPAPASGDNDSPTSLKLSTVLGTVAGNYQTYHQVAARLVACQDWISSQYQAVNGTPLSDSKTSPR